MTPTDARTPATEPQIDACALCTDRENPPEIEDAELGACHVSCLSRLHDEIAEYAENRRVRESWRIFQQIEDDENPHPYTIDIDPEEIGEESAA